jgi:hypothetical protein
MAQTMNPTFEGQEWLVLINQDNRRMMSTREVQAEVQAGLLARETLVWRAGMNAWASIGSIAELAAQNSRPTVPRQRPPGYNPRLAETMPANRIIAAQYLRPAPAPNPQLMLELMATGAVVALIVAITSYSLYTAGAFKAGGDVPAPTHAHAGTSKTNAAH